MSVYIRRGLWGSLPSSSGTQTLPAPYLVRPCGGFARYFPLHPLTVDQKKEKKISIKSAGGIALIQGLTQSVGISSQHGLCQVPLAAPAVGAGLQGEKFQECLNSFRLHAAGRCLHG